MLITFSGVASNFAGVPLAFAFVATLGRTGFVTAVLKNVFNVNIYNQGFNLYSFVGLSLTYMYFQFPLMVLIMAPALDGLKRGMARKLAENLGASTTQYWLRIALPILLPSLLGSMILLFGNVFGAYATAYALTGGALPIITIQIGAQIRGHSFIPLAWVMQWPWDGGHYGGFPGRLSWLQVGPKGGGDEHCCQARKIPFWSWFWFVLGPFISSCLYMRRSISRCAWSVIR